MYILTLVVTGFCCLHHGAIDITHFGNKHDFELPDRTSELKNKTFLTRMLFRQCGCGTGLSVNLTLIVSSISIVTTVKLMHFNYILTILSLQEFSQCMQS